MELDIDISISIFYFRWLIPTFLKGKIWRKGLIVIQMTQGKSVGRFFRNLL